MEQTGSLMEVSDKGWSEGGLDWDGRDRGSDTSRSV